MRIQSIEYNYRPTKIAFTSKPNNDEKLERKQCLKYLSDNCLDEKLWRDVNRIQPEYFLQLAYNRIVKKQQEYDENKRNREIEDSFGPGMF